MSLCAANLASIRIACVASLALVPLMSANGVELPARDWRGSQDHPMFTRFNGAIISAYQTLDYDQLPIPLGRHKQSPNSFDGEFEKGQFVEGKVTRIAYAIPENKTSLEVFRNYEQALGAAGFKSIYTCAANDCGGYRFSQALGEEVINKDLGDNRVLIASLLPVGGDVRHMSAVLTRPAGDVYATITVSRKPSEPVGVLLRVAEIQGMQTGQVQVKADAIAKAIAAEGKIALYGILFDTDSATIRADSKPALEEMARFLKSQPNTKVFIVGHTDNTGAIAHNLDLSQRRADAVVKALTSAHGVPTNQVNAKGLASYAPVASNRDEAGRAKNRRVEIVEQ